MFVLGGCLYVGGAIGVELIQGRHYESYRNDLSYNMIGTVEESLEMAGVIVFLSALLKYLADNNQEVQIRFGNCRRERAIQGPTAGGGRIVVEMIGEMDDEHKTEAI